MNETPEPAKPQRRTPAILIVPLDCATPPQEEIGRADLVVVQGAGGDWRTVKDRYNVRAGPVAGPAEAVAAMLARFAQAGRRPDRGNDERRAHACEALAAYNDASGGPREDPETTIGDLVTDLLHLAEDQGCDAEAIERILRCARRDWRAERKEDA